MGFTQCFAICARLQRRLAGVKGGDRFLLVAKYEGDARITIYGLLVSMYLFQAAMLRSGDSRERTPQKRLCWNMEQASS